MMNLLHSRVLACKLFRSSASLSSSKSSIFRSFATKRSVKADKDTVVRETDPKYFNASNPNATPAQGVTNPQPQLSALLNNFRPLVAPWAITKANFEKDIQPAVDYLTLELQYSKEQLSALYKRRPVTLLAQNEKNKSTIKEVRDFFEKTGGLSTEQFRNLFLKFPTLQKFSVQELAEKLKWFEDQLGITTNQAAEMILSYPPLILADQKEMTGIIELFQLYAETDKQTLRDMQVKTPYIFATRAIWVEKILSFLRQRFFTPKEINQIGLTHGEVYAMRPGTVKINVSLIADAFDLSKEEILFC
eukprot:TRINITY_DN7602_c0_g1_i1.p1 TRINITY_DN7602_c0_g1~~TRINITY_DN7602_c0_g1_i1.p1  ORF type:complete len:304 (+),score=68.66 TRINITY_DN7602_c0_g1_i1:151-1062(+)